MNMFDCGKRSCTDCGYRVGPCCEHPDYLAYLGFLPEGDAAKVNYERMQQEYQVGEKEVEAYG